MKLLNAPPPSCSCRCSSSPTAPDGSTAPALRDRVGGQVKDLQDQLALDARAVLIGHLAGDAGFVVAPLQRRDNRCIAVGDDVAPHLAGAGDLVVVGVEL